MVSQVLTEIEDRRVECVGRLDPERRALFGQFFTPLDVALFMAELFDVEQRPVRLLDPGAGVGSLTAAVVGRWHSAGGGSVAVTAVEADSSLRAPLARTLDELSAVHDVTSNIVHADFIEWGCDRVSGFGVLDAPTFDIVVMNPPYRKIHTKSAERRRMSAAGIDVPNLYAGFVALGARLLRDGGQLVAITPRSFTNGPYFRRFRQLLLDSVGLQRIHVFDTRDFAFADSAVLQENVIFHGVRGRRVSSLVVSSSGSPSEAARVRRVSYSDVVRPDDPESFLHLTLDDEAALCARRMSALPARLSDLRLTVSTGPVVDFRSKPHLRGEPEPATVPLVYPGHLREGRVQWPQLGGRKANGLVNCEATSRLLMPAGTYVLVKRFSAKEERRRIVAVVVTPDDLPGELYAFENHLNVFHDNGGGLPRALASGLAAFLNTTTVDQYLRQFNGHTQVNATDLRSIRYPSEETLVELGTRVEPGIDQDKLDRLAADVIAAFRIPFD